MGRLWRKPRYYMYQLKANFESATPRDIKKEVLFTSRVWQYLWGLFVCIGVLH